MGMFVLGAVLLLIAIIGGNFELFGAKFATAVDDPRLRRFSGILGGTFIVWAIAGNVIIALVGARSTSTTGSGHGTLSPPSLRTLRRTPSAPALASVGSELYIVARDGTGTLYFTHGASPETFVNWDTLRGIRTPDPPAAAALGSELAIAIRDRDRQLYFTHGSSDGGFAPWQPLEFSSLTKPSLCSMGDRTYVFAVGIDNRVWRAALNATGGTSAWSKIPDEPHSGETFSAPASTAVGAFVYVTIRDSNDQLYLNQFDADGGYVGWLEMRGGAFSHVEQAMASVGNRAYSIATHPDGLVFFDYWDKGGGSHGWREIPGLQTEHGPAAAGLNNEVYVAVSSMDGEIYMNHATMEGSFGDRAERLGFKRD